MGWGEGCVAFCVCFGASVLFGSGPLYYVSSFLLILLSVEGVRVVVDTIRRNRLERQQMRDMVRYSETGAGRLTRSSARVWAADEEPQKVQ